MSYSLRNAVADYGGLKPTQRYVLETLALYANDDGTSCHPSLDRVAHDTGYHRTTVDDVVGVLKQRGVLIVVEAQSRRPVDYRINLSVLPRREPYVTPGNDRLGRSRTPYLCRARWRGS